MKKILLTLCVTAALTSVAYADDQMPANAAPNATTTTTTTDASMKANPNANNQTSADSLVWLMAVDQNEINTSKVAMKKATNPTVKNYANMMIKQHSQNLSQTRSLAKKLKIKTKDTTDATDVKEAGKKEVDNLKTLSGKDFDKSYIDTMVTDHSDALSKLDSFIGDDKNAKVEAHLKSTREAVQHHLDEGKKIQSNM